MTEKAGKPKMETVHQHSAGGVAFRSDGPKHEIAVIRTTEEGRWQLPKGIIDPGETPEQAAVREVSEEAGLTCEIVEPIETIEYWFVASYDGPRKRYHKKVSFYLMEYLSGDVADHDHEVTEARWVTFDDALAMLSFQNERAVVEKAREMVRS
jgi:8-oxo-dGTP pyrophosphatase MutT (NUDIX family)